MSEPVIKAKGLGKRYRLFDRPGDWIKELLSPTRHRYHREFWALRELDLEVSKGECVGLVGANGAGKSTTLKLLAGKLNPTTGTAEVRGRLSSILELGTGFQPHLTGRQNAFVSALFMGLAPWEADGHVERIIEFAEIGAHADQPLVTYSSGMQARLAFAALTTLDPEVLILDEALATGDARFAQKCNDYLRALCRSGCTTIIASHDVRFLVGTCDRLVWIDHGRVVDQGAPRAIVQRYLEASGSSVADDAARPRQVLLRLAAADVKAEVAFAVHALHWVDEAGGLIGQHYLGDDTSWQSLLEGATAAGFTSQGARAGWGPAELSSASFLFRTCRPAAGGAVFVTLPLPAAPAPVPSGLRVVIENAAACDAVFSLQVDGRWTEVGRAGRVGSTDQPWQPTTLDVRPALSRTSAPAVVHAGRSS